MTQKDYQRETKARSWEPKFPPHWSDPSMRIFRIDEDGSVKNGNGISLPRVSLQWRG